MGMFRRVIASVLVAAIMLSVLPTAALAEMVEEIVTEEEAVVESMASEPEKEDLPDASEGEYPVEAAAEPETTGDAGEVDGSGGMAAEPEGSPGVEPESPELSEDVVVEPEVTPGEEPESPEISEDVVVGPEVAPGEETEEDSSEGLQDTLEWDLDAEGLLTVTGTGPMEQAPWSEYMESVTRVSVGEGVTSICDGAFDGASNLMLVLLPNSLEAIGAFAFRNCTILGDIVIPGNVTQIGQGAFAGCGSMRMVRILGYDVTIGENAFEGLNSSVGYPHDSNWWTGDNYGGNLNWLGYVRVLGTGLYDCSRWMLEEYGSMQIFGIGPLSDQPSAADYPWASFGNSISFVSCTGVDNVPQYAFAGCGNLSSIYLGGVGSVGAGAFSGCGNLNMIDILGVAEIAADAFRGVTASVSYKEEDGWLPEQMQDYGGDLNWLAAYSGNYGDGIWWELSGDQLVIYSMTGEQQTMEQQSSAAGYPWYAHRDRISTVFASNVDIGDYAFDGYTNLKTFETHTGTTVGTCAFRGCSALADITFGGEVPVIAADAFTGVTARVYYHGYNGWNSSHFQDYGGDLTWSEIVYEEPELASGTHGDNATWKLTSYGILTITGEGEMEAGTSAEDYGWYEYRDQIQDVTVSGLTSVADYAFAGYPMLSRLEMQESVTSVGSHILDGSPSVEYVTFNCMPPESIAEDAFAGLSNATLLYPYRYDEQWQTAIESTYGGTDLHWSRYTVSIAHGQITGGYWNIQEDGYMHFNPNQLGGSYSIGDMEAGAAPWSAYADIITNVAFEGITSIGANAFYGLKSLTGVEFPETLKTIGEQAFAGCTAMEMIQFKGTVDSIGENAFRDVTATACYGTEWDSTMMLDYGGDLTWEFRSMWIDGGMLESVNWNLYSDGELSLYADAETVMPSQASPEAYPWHGYADRIKSVSYYNITGFGDYAFAGCTGLTSFTFDYRVTTLGNHIFEDCTNLKELIFHGSAPEFSENTFYGVTARVEYPTGDESWTADKLQDYGGDITWGDSENEETDIYGTCGENLTWKLSEDGVLTVSGTGDMNDYDKYNLRTEWYWDAQNVKRIVIEEGVTSVGSCAFSGDFGNVTEISIPDSLVSIGDYAFEDCVNVKTLTFGSQLESIGNYAFISMGLTGTLTLPDSLKTIGIYAFSGCNSLTALELGSGLESIGGYAFGNCSGLESITMTGDAPAISDSALKWTTTTIYYPIGNPTWTDAVRQNYGGTITWVPVGELGGSCGEDLAWTLDAEGTLTISGTGAMTDYGYEDESAPWRDYSEDIRRVVILEAVTSIGIYAFAGCRNLTDVRIPDSVTRIGGYAFAGCSALNDVAIPEGVVYIGDLAFCDCVSLTGITIPVSVTTIGEEAFAGCTGLTDVTIPSGVTSMGAWAFEGCSGITHIRFECVDCPAIAENTLGSLSALESIYVPGENYASYEALLDGFSDEVEIQTDWEYFPVEYLTVENVYSRTAVLSWDGHRSGEEAGYIVLRDGVEVGRTTDWRYTDRTLEPETAYRYAVQAYFEDGRVTPESDVVTAETVLPEITGLSGYVEYAGIKKFADVWNTVEVVVPDKGNLAPLGDQTHRLGLYYSNGGEETLIGWANTAAPRSVGYLIDWNVSLLSDGEYTLRAVLTDVDGTTDEWTETVTVDNTPPGKLQQLAVTGSEEDIALSWTQATEYDTLGYRIYRSEGTQDAFTLLVQIDGREKLTYTDTTASESAIYYYYVVGVDIFGREAREYDIVGGSRISDTVKPRVVQLLPASGTCLTGAVTFTVRAEDNVSVTGTRVEYALDGGEVWTELSARNGKYPLDTTSVGDGKIQVRAFAYDAAENCSDAFVQTYFIDNTGPEQVTGLAHVSTGVTLTLSWKDVADQDIGGFRVEQKQPDGSYSVVADRITALGVNLQGLAPGTEYTYRVTAYDIYGNLGTPSEAYTASTALDTTAPVTVQILPGSGVFADAISLSATVKDDYCVASASLEYSVDNVVWNELCSESFSDVAAVRKISGTLDLAEIPEGMLYVRVTAVDRAGNESVQPPFVQHMVDKTAPAAPSNVTAEGSSGYVELRWDSVPGAASYQVYRADSQDGVFALLSENHTYRNYVDRNVEDGTVYYYRLTAADEAGNVSEFCGTVSARASFDTVAPEILSVAPSDGSALSGSFPQVSVLAKDNSELESIVLEYSHDGQTYLPLAEKTQIGAYGSTAAGNVPIGEFAHGDPVYLRFTAVDAAGNACESEVYSYTVDIQAPEVNTVTACCSENVVVLTWTGGAEPDLAGYRIYRCDSMGSSALIGQVAAEAGKTEYTWTDKDLPASGGFFTYQVEAVDVLGNTATGSSFETVPGQNTPVVEVPRRTGPTALLSCDSVMTTGIEYIIDGSGSTDDGQIISYVYDFGDGTSGTGKSPIHTYSQEGSYKISLTVTDDEGLSHTFSKWVKVKTPELVGNVTVRIVDEKGAPVPNAPVYFDLGEETQVIRGTDTSGYASFTAEVGKHTVGCVILNNQWLPVKRDLIVKAGETTSVSMTLINKPIMEGSFEIKRMTLEEIEAAGIDLTDPENQYYVEVELHLEYENAEFNTTIPGGALGGGRRIIFDSTGSYKHEEDDDPDPVIITPDNPGPDDGSGGSIRGWYVELIDKSKDPKLMILDIPIGVQSLKEMFDVRLHILNNSSSEFSMLDNVITLDVPDGLSVVTDAYMKSQQTAYVGEIRGQTQETVEWIVRGDLPGEYMIGADYSGILSQFNEPLTARFEAQDPIQVYGMSGMKLTILYADELESGTLYYNVMLTNEGETDIYKPSISTEDILIEMELYDEAGMTKAEMVDFSAESISQIAAAKSLSSLPDILKVGDTLVMHYMSIDQTDYTHCEMKLRNQAVEYEHTYGLENVVIASRPLSYFTEIFSTDINPVEKADNSHNAAKGAYDQLVENSRYMCWALARDMIADNYLPSDLDELGWEAINGDGLKGRSKDVKQAQALILEALKLSGAASSEFQSEIWVKFLKALKKILPVIPLDSLNITVEQREALTSAMVDVINENYKEIYATKTPMDDLIISVWEEKCDEVGVEFVGEERAKKTLHKMYSHKDMEDFWKTFGIGTDVAGKILEGLEETVVDVNIYLKAQANVSAHLMLLDAMILYTDTPEMEALYYVTDTQIVVDALKDVRKAIQEENIMGKVASNVIQKLAQYGQGKAVDWAVDKILDVAGASVSGIFAWATKTLELTAKGLDLLMNISEQYTMADNIRFAAILSEATVLALEDEWELYESYGSRENAEDYMKLLALLLDLRAMGESQVALYGKSFETDFTVGNLKLLKAVRAESDAEEATSWYQWRDIVEDRISRLRVQLLKNPLTTEVTGRNQPTVSFNYTAGETLQSFSSDYEYSLDMGATWVTCSGGPIAVERPKTMQELWVRRVDRSNTDMTDTASVTIYGAVSLSSGRIEVLRTEDGYRINNLDSSKTYQVTFSETPIAYTYDMELENSVPAGSLSYQYTTGRVCNYVYIRALANENGFASEITQVPVTATVDLHIRVTGEGSVGEVPNVWEYGSQVSVTAVPAENRIFDGWYCNGTRVSGSLTYTFNIYGSMYLEARFLETAEVVLPGVSAAINAEDGSAKVTTDSGMSVAITGAPATAQALVVETVRDTAVQEQVTDSLAQIGTPVQIFAIYTIDAEKNPTKLNGERVTLEQADLPAGMLLCGIADDGTATVLDRDGQDGGFSFAGDGSAYYVLVTLPADREIEVETDAEEVLPGMKAELTARFLPGNPTEAKILWSLAEGDDVYATLKTSGDTAVLTALAATGSRSVTVTASASDGSFPSTSVEILVVPYVHQLNICMDETDVTGGKIRFDINRGESLLELTAAVAPLDASQEVAWSISGDEGVAEVTGNGLVTFLGETGTVKVTASATDGSKKSAAVTIEVVALTQNVKMAEDSVTELVGGESCTFSAVDADTGTVLTKTQLTWSLDDRYAAYASITAAGKLTTREVAEETVIVITGRVVGNEEIGMVEHPVILRPEVTYVELYHDGKIVNGETILVDTGLATEEDLPQLALEAVLYPGDAMEGVTWKSLNPGVADVDSDGTVTVKWDAAKQTCKSGTVTITATAADGSKAVGSVKLNVGIFVKKITVEAPELELRSGQKMTLTAETLPENPTKAGVIWSLAGEDDENYASISSGGKLTAKTVYDDHMVTVRATAKDGSGVYEDIYVKISPKTDGILTICSGEKNITKSTVSVDLNGTGEILLEAYTLGDYLKESTVTWISSSKTAAALEDHGDGSVTVTMLKGATTITAKAEDGRTATVTLKAVRMTESITIGAKTGEMTVASGKSLNLTASVLPANATTRTVLWSVAEKDADYATISSSGKLTAAKNLREGRMITVIATAKDGGASQTAEVWLTPLATDISLFLDGRPVSDTTYVNNMADCDMLQLEAKVYPLDQASNAVTWKSSNKKIASIDEDGMITCLKAGTVTITATANDGSKVKSTFKLKVEKWMTELTLPDTAVIAGGKTLTVTKLADYFVDPDATNKNLVWTMEGEGAAFATLSNKGVLKTKKVTEPKTLTVTATAADAGGISAECEVTIYPATTKVQILYEGEAVTQQLTLAEGDSLCLEGSSLPVNAADTYTWKSSAVKYAEVDESGVVTAIKAGKTVSISCTAADGSGKGAVVKIKIVAAE